MTMPLDFREQIEKSIENNTGVMFEKFFDEEDTPKWEELLSSLHDEAKLENTKHFQEHEIPYGNVLLSSNLYLASHIQVSAREKHFSRISKLINIIRESTDIEMCIIGPRVCIGPHRVDFHIDSWHAFALQCEGKVKWTLSDTKDGTGSYFEEFYPNRGDLLFFPQGVWHAIETQDAIRGGLQLSARIFPKK